MGRVRSSYFQKRLCSIAHYGISSEDDGEEDPEQADPDTMDVDADSIPPENKDDLSKYNLDDFDDDVQETSNLSLLFLLNLSLTQSDVGPFTNIKGLQYYQNNDADPYITIKEVNSMIISPSY